MNAYFVYKTLYSMKIKFIVLIFLYLTSGLLAKPIEPIIVSEQNFKLTGKKEFYFSFAKGDEILISLEVVKGKNIKELIVEEYPTTSRYNDFKVSTLNNKSIKVQQDGIYKFTLKSGLGLKIVRFKLQRIPLDENTKEFNTNIDWIEKIDTTYKVYTKKVIVGYDSTWVTRYRKILIKVDTIVHIESRLERVHSQTNLSSANYTNVTMRLPQIQNEGLKERKIESWSYRIEAGGKKSIGDNMRDFSLSLVGTNTKEGALAGIALGTVSSLSAPPKGDNVKYSIDFFDYQKKAWYNLGTGNSVLAYAPVKNLRSGEVKFFLENDNIVNGINVVIEMCVIIIEESYREEPYQQMIVSAIKELKSFKDPIYTKSTIPVIRR